MSGLLRESLKHYFASKFRRPVINLFLSISPGKRFSKTPIVNKILSSIDSAYEYTLLGSSKQTSLFVQRNLHKIKFLATLTKVSEERAPGVYGDAPWRVGPHISLMTNFRHVCNCDIS